MNVNYFVYEYRFYCEPEDEKVIVWTLIDYDEDADKYFMSSIQNGRAVSCWRRLKLNKVKRSSRKYYSVMMNDDNCLDDGRKMVQNHMANRTRVISKLYVDYMTELKAFYTFKRKENA